MIPAIMLQPVEPIQRIYVERVAGALHDLRRIYEYLDTHYRH